MRKLIIGMLFTLVSTSALAAGGGYHLSPAKVDISNKESLKRGAQLFVDYCLSCHSAQFQRYNRMATDLGIGEEDLKAKYMHASEKVGDTMTIAMDKGDAKKWFGNPPPDLSVITRARGEDWIYTYLISFYKDEKRPFGVNNALFPDVGMPHVLESREGVLKEAKFETTTDADGNDHTALVGFSHQVSGAYEQDARDLTAFLSYVGEPVQETRKSIGVYVMIFLIIFTIVAYLLKKEYWRDVH